MKWLKMDLTAKGRTISIVGSIGIYIILCFVLLGLLSSVFVAVLGNPSRKAMLLSDYLALQAAVLFSVCISTLFMLRFVNKLSLSEFGLSIKGRWRDIVCGLLAAVLLYGIGFGTSLLLGEVEIERVNWDVLALLLTLVLFILVSFSEEIMVRGYVLGRLLQTSVHRFVALALSSVLFSLMHLFNPNIAFLPMLNLFLAGLLLGASFLYTRNLWFPISLHLFWNWIQGPVLGYEVSGNVFSSSILKLYLPQNNIINGGKFGFEGSIICTVLLLLFTGIIIGYFECRKALR